ncbi:MAG TPA: hypothetical protein VL358_14445 [Caulobacteraceae bacterium]|jgi:predicted protein tyrosine phosphatase|nr:hypothetical protein [Caulobacteraceae bacterium]
MTLIVCPLSQVESVIAARAPSHLVTLLDPSYLIATPPGLAPERHLKLGVNDVVEQTEGRICADSPTIARLLAFGAGWDGAQPMLIHCWAGISRSTAAAFALACQRDPEAPELKIAEALRAASAVAHPNRRIVALADALLDRGGRMVEAIEAIGPGESADENRAFDLPVRYR